MIVSTPTAVVEESTPTIVTATNKGLFYLHKIQEQQLQVHHKTNRCYSDVGGSTFTSSSNGNRMGAPIAAVEKAAATTLIQGAGAPTAVTPSGMVEVPTAVTAPGAGAPTLSAVVAPGTGAVAPTAVIPTVVTAQGVGALSA
jgi:hypothetical protein